MEQARPRIPLLIAVILTIAVYWSGLSGPFIFDDLWNLEPVRLWQAGEASLREVLFPQESIVLSRPVAMASFALTTWLFGDTTFSFKLGNLVVHLACGLLGYLVLRRALQLDRKLSMHAPLLASLVAALWLLHPLHVSTVLYSVQRMAQLSTMFSLAAVWLYLVGRQQLVRGDSRAAHLNLFAGFPALLILGVLSKQNAAVVPVICLIMELAFFHKPMRREASVAAFFTLFLLLPMVAAGALFLLAPGKFLGGYAEWDFTLWERLLTQPRALIDYIGMLLFPRGPAMGLYTDDYAISSGLLSPPSTLFALLTLTGISVAAVALRARAASLFAGWFFFLAAHAVESSFLPLEMYYEHRNYLPSIGLLWAVIGMTALIPSFRTNALSPFRLGLLAGVGTAVIFCVATLGRVLVWQNMETIAKLGVRAHPDSLRARYDLASWALKTGDHATAQKAFRHLANSRYPRHRQLGYLSMVTVNCMRGVDADNLVLLERAAAENLHMLTTFEAQAFLLMSSATKEEGCVGLPRREIAANLKEMLDAAIGQPETASPKWFSRYALAEIYARDGQWQAAEEQMELAWAGGRDKKVGAFLARVYIQNGHQHSAQALLEDLSRLIQPYDKQGQETLSDIRNLVGRTGQRPRPARAAAQNFSDPRND